MKRNLRTQNVPTIKLKIDKLEFIKIKNFSSSNTSPENENASYRWEICDRYIERDVYGKGHI